MGGRNPELTPRSLFGGPGGEFQTHSVAGRFVQFGGVSSGSPCGDVVGSGLFFIYNHQLGARLYDRFVQG